MTKNTSSGYDDLINYREYPKKNKIMNYSNKEQPYNYSDSSFTHMLKSEWDTLGNPLGEARPSFEESDGIPLPNWPGATKEQLQFMYRVYRIAFQRSSRNGNYVKDLPPSALGTIEGNQKARKDTASAARKLLLELREEIDKESLKIEVGISSAFRSASSQLAIWQRNFIKKYYAETRTQRLELPGGEYGADAASLVAKYTSRRVATPGFSKHNTGLAIDFASKENGMLLSANTSRKSLRDWQNSWIWDWLMKHANRFCFYQNTAINEPWHWEYRCSEPKKESQILERSYEHFSEDTPLTRENSRSRRLRSNRREISGEEKHSSFFKRNQFVYEYIINSPKISIYTLKFFKIKAGFTGFVRLQNQTKDAQFRFILNKGLLEQRIDDKLNSFLTRRMFESWEEAIVNNIIAHLTNLAKGKYQGPVDLENLLIESSTVPNALTLQRGRISWEMGQDLTIRIFPPTLSLYIVKGFISIINRPLGVTRIGSVPIELNFNGTIVLAFGLSVGGWRFIFKQVLKAVGIEASFTLLKSIAQQLGLTLALTYSISYLSALITKHAQLRGWRRGMANAYAHGFTQIIWEENRIPGLIRSDSIKFFERGKKDAKTVINLNVKTQANEEYVRVAQEIKQHLVTAFFPGRRASSIERSTIAFQLGERIHSGDGIPLPYNRLPF